MWRPSLGLVSAAISVSVRWESTSTISAMYEGRSAAVSGLPFTSARKHSLAAVSRSLFGFAKLSDTPVDGCEGFFAGRLSLSMVVSPGLEVWH